MRADTRGTARAGSPSGGCGTSRTSGQVLEGLRLKVSSTTSWRVTRGGKVSPEGAKSRYLDVVGPPRIALGACRVARALGRVYPPGSLPCPKVFSTVRAAGADRSARTYRTKFEVLHDLLAAVCVESRKTRIIDRANLNHTSFDRYARVAISAGLLRKEHQEYLCTPKTDEWLRTARGVLDKGFEVSHALTGLARVTWRPGSSGVSSEDHTLGLARQLVARLAWERLRTAPSSTRPATSDRVRHRRPPGIALALPRHLPYEGSAA
jgi:predicted transcriptional regulator